jgi:hypothetical protein
VKTSNLTNLSNAEMRYPAELSSELHRNRSGQLVFVILMFVVQSGDGQTDTNTQLANTVLMYKTCSRGWGRMQSGMLNQNWQITAIHDSQQLNDECEN